MSAGAHQYAALHDDFRSPSRNPRRPIRWRRLLNYFLAFIPVLVFAAGSLLLSFLTLRISDTNAQYGCDPEGRIWVTQANRPNLWSHTFGLAITLGFGSFNFTQAKAIDIAWDLIVSRGSQVLCGLALYYIFRGPVVASMHQSNVPYEKIVKMQYHTAGIPAFLTYCQDLRRKKWSRYQTYAGWMLAISAGYVLLLPTLVSAMTGYQPISLPLLMLTSNTYTSFDALTNCTYIVQDGPRIGLDAMACIKDDTIMATRISSYIKRYMTYNYTGGWTGNSNPLSASQKPSILLNPAGRHLNLPSPLLNITKNDFADGQHAIFFDGRSYSVAELTEQGYCAPQPEFRWGFSLILLFMFLSVTFLISVLIYVVWAGHYWRDDSTLDEVHFVFGDLRTPLAVGESIREELGLETAALLSDDQLKAAVGTRGAGLKLRGLRRSRGSQYEGMRIRTDTFKNAQVQQGTVSNVPTTDRLPDFREELEMDDQLRRREISFV